LSQSQSSLRFSLEEYVWFKKGQEVDELLSISLDPHITIQEQEQYVQIIGNLQLQGEYKGGGEEYEEKELDLHGKFVHQVEYREDDGVYQFEHRFPVDVTIPKNRINQLEDIDVSIDMFDYILPEKGKLKLTADLSIFGIRNEEMEESDEQEIPISLLEPEVNEQVSETESEDNTEESVNVDPELFETESESIPEYHLERGLPVKPQPEEEEKEGNNEEEFVDFKVDEELFQPFVIEARKEPEDHEEMIENKEEEPILNLGIVNESEEEFLQVSGDHRNESSAHYEDTNEIESSPSDQSEAEEEDESPEEEDQSKTKKKKKFGKYESISLADFFARKADDKAAKLKVVIVQNGETLDYLADKYEISVQQILRMNHLEINQDVYEGQVLYIPSYVSATKK
jgi:stage VI sporulation protein D